MLAGICECGLTRFTIDGQVAIDNNPAERAMRPPALGRKNYLFVGRGNVGERTAAMAELLPWNWAVKKEKEQPPLAAYLTGRLRQLSLSACNAQCSSIYVPTSE